MINLIGLCKSLREKYPIPTKPKSIYDTIVDTLKEDPPQETQKDIINALSAHWKRAGWTWNPSGAVLLEEDEQVVFHSAGLTFVKQPKDMTGGMVWFKPVRTGEVHPRVIWF